MQAPKKTANIREALRGKASMPADSGAALAANKSAIEEGRKPLGARRTDIAALQAKATELYGIPPTGLAAIPAIESGFKFSPADSDRDHNYLRVEALLDQAAELLGRCREARAQRDALQVEKWK